MQGGNLRHAALEVQVDIDDMPLGDRLDVRTALVTLRIVVAEDDGDDTVLLQVEDIRLTGHIERGQLLRRTTLDGELLLQVRQLTVVILRDQYTRHDIAALVIGLIVVEDILHRMAIDIVADAVVLTTIVVGLVDITLLEVDDFNMGLLVCRQITVSL